MKFSQLQVIVAAGALATVASLAAPSFAAVVSFGSGGNQFNMEFVTIGNAGNAADTTGVPNPAGAVGYEYGIGKFEVSRNMITKYNSAFGTANSLEISLENMTSFGGNGANKPATGVSWYEAARFVNWLNTSTGNQAAYKFTSSGVEDPNDLWTSGDAGYDATNQYRNSLAKYVLPSYNEWHKAAYYDPINDTYYDYPTGSNTAPIGVASGTTAGTAVFSAFFFEQSGPADVNQAGGLSPYGVMGLGGNVWEYEETSYDLANDGINSTRAMRGGVWLGLSESLSSSIRSGINPDGGNIGIGFRVASVEPFSGPPPAVPEPSMMVIGTLFGIGGVMAKRRMKK